MEKEYVVLVTDNNENLLLKVDCGANVIMADYIFYNSVGFIHAYKIEIRTPKGCRDERKF